MQILAPIQKKYIVSFPNFLRLTANPPQSTSQLIPKLYILTMPKSKLKLALDREKGKDYTAEKEKKKRKLAEKQKRAKGILPPVNGKRKSDEGEEEEEEESEYEEMPKLVDADTPAPEMNGKMDKKENDEEEEEDASGEEKGEEGEEEEEEEDEEEEDNEGDEDEEDEDEDEVSDVALSDIEDENDLVAPDLIPHTRLTINNRTALLSSLSTFALPISTLPFSTHMSLTTSTRTPDSIPDINDDLTREQAFYNQALGAAKQARDLLAKENAPVPFSRPLDYFAEMVKSDEHMGKIKQKLLDEAADRKAGQEAKKQRELRKFGKKVQIEKLQERQKQKTETLNKIQALKRKRASGEDDLTTNEPDIFDVALDNSIPDPSKPNKRSRTNGAYTPNPKRQKKNEKFGFGGKAKKMAKRNTKDSAEDISGFSVKANKARFGSGGGGGKKKRLGKSVRKAKRG